MHKSCIVIRPLYKGVLLCLAFSWFLLQCGCGGYAIKYDLGKYQTPVAGVTQPMSIAVAVFSDVRPLEERADSVRKKSHSSNLGDYTYDREFKGPVDEGVTEMITKHLEYSNVFTNVVMTHKHREEITDQYLDSLRGKGVDAILIGRINHFYGYYEQDLGRQLALALPLACLGLPLYFDSYHDKTTYFLGEPITTVEIDYVKQLMGELVVDAGVALGFVLESTFHRDIEWRTDLSFELVNTANLQVLCTDSVNVAKKFHGAMPGVDTNHRKFEVALESLRDAVNQFVHYIGGTSLNESPVSMP